jgi:hypothetical protein
MGFSHPQGEVHITSPGNAVACPGKFEIFLLENDHSFFTRTGNDDATDQQCTIASVPNIIEGDILNHLGPYQGIYLGTIFCT